MQYLLSIRAATCQGRKWACPGRICSWQIILGLNLSFHYFPCIKANFVSCCVSRNFQELKLGCFLLWYCPSWFFPQVTAAPVPCSSLFQGWEGIPCGSLQDPARPPRPLSCFLPGLADWKSPKWLKCPSLVSLFFVVTQWTIVDSPCWGVRRKNPSIILAFPVSPLPILEEEHISFSPFSPFHHFFLALTLEGQPHLPGISPFLC